MHEHRPQLKLILAVCLGLVATRMLLSHSGRSGGTSVVPARAPSVVLITLDTVRADHIGCYGYRRIETPSIDRLADEGIRFEHAYAQVPLTLPSHTVIMTGKYPMSNGVRDLTSPGLSASVPTIAGIMRQNGYTTAAFVSSMVLNSMWGLNSGFEVYDDETDPADRARQSFASLERRGDRTVDRALAWLGSHSGRSFFLWVHLYDPHTPYRPPEPYLSRYAGHLYDGEIAFDDTQVGRLLARLRELKLYESALVVLAGDHGESLGEHGEAEHGFFIYSATLHVPLILKLPATAPRTRVVNAPAGLVDLAPTIFQLCGISRRFTESLEGHPLPGIQEDAGAQQTPDVYAESYYPRNTFGWHELRAILTSQYEYIDAPRPELYSLERDGGELHNLTAARSALALALRDRLELLESRYGNTKPAPSPGPLDSATIEKLRSLGYVAYKAPKNSSDSALSRSDPKDKIVVLNQILHAGNLRSQRRFAESDEILRGLEKSEPSLYILGFERGETLLDWGKARDSIAEFRKALAINPTFDEAWSGLGRAEFALGENQNAAEALGLALRLNPRNYLSRRLLARVYLREDKPLQAERELAQVVSEHPDFAEARAEHGLALAKVKRFREAIAELQAASNCGYRDAVAYYYLGVSYSETGDTSDAIGAYQKAVEIDPNYAAAWARLALQYRQRGESSKANEYYRRTCQLSKELCLELAGQF